MRIALTVLAVIGLAVAAVVPVVWTAGLRADAEAAEIDAAALRTPILAEPGPAIVTVETEMFRRIDQIGRIPSRGRSPATKTTRGDLPAPQDDVSDRYSLASAAACPCPASPDRPTTSPCRAASP